MKLLIASFLICVAANILTPFIIMNKKPDTSTTFVIMRQKADHAALMVKRTLTNKGRSSYIVLR